MAGIQTTDRAFLRQFMEARLNLSELKVIAFDIGVDYEMFPHETKPDFVVGLVQYLERKNRLRSLVEQLIEEQSDPKLVELLTRLQGGEALQKVQVILSNDKIESKPGLREKLAELLGVATDDVMLIATAAGSIKLLLGLPDEAIGRLEALDLPHQLDQYRIVDVTRYVRLPKGAQTTWRNIVLDAIARSAGVPAAGGAAAGGITLGKILLWVIGILIVSLLLVGGAAAVWIQRLPDMTVVNSCSTTLSLKVVPPQARSMLGLPDELARGESIEFPLISGAGRYELLVEGRPPMVVLVLPRALPLVNVDQIPLGSADSNERFVINDQLVRIPGQFRVARNEEIELIFCADR